MRSATGPMRTASSSRWPTGSAATPAARSRAASPSKCWRARWTAPREAGQELIVGIDVLSLDVKPGDVLLQCSDGIHGALGEAELGELLAAHPPEAACRALVRRGREEGGEDNLSAQVAAVIDCPPPTARP